MTCRPTTPVPPATAIRMPSLLSRGCRARIRGEVHTDLAAGIGPVPQKVEDGRVHAGLDGGEGGARLTGLGAGELHGGAADRFLVDGAVDDARGERVGAPIAAAG